MDTFTVPYVSVVVPVYNDRVRLVRCLTALEQQTYPADRYEVIVVDNGSREPVADLLERFPHSSLAVEGRPGSYAARNTGIELASGEVLAFTDADCTPATDWLMRGVQRLCGEPDVGLVGGRIKLYFRDPEDPTTAELYERLFSFRQDENIRRYSFGSTSNIFTHRRVVEDVGAFVEDLKSAGDVEWGQRVAAAGYQLVYADDAVVDHPSRHSIAALMSRRRRMVGGRIDLTRHRQRTKLTRPQHVTKLTRPQHVLWGAKLVQDLIRIVRDPGLDGFIQRVRLMGVALTLRWIVLSETIRVRAGGESLRE